MSAFNAEYEVTITDSVTVDASDEDTAEQLALERVKVAWPEADPELITILGVSEEE